MADVAAEAYALMNPCRLCPRRCMVNRGGGEEGFCGVGSEVLLSSVGPHFGEEPVLVGRGGSGTIFLAGCNLLCSFCQNYDLSHLRRGSPVGVDEIMQMMMGLARRGCHNINFVTPSHVMPQLLDAILRARHGGMTLPVVWNCGGYESVEALELLEGHVDIYMPDAKFAEGETGERLASAPDYFEVMKAALLEMHRQVGDLVIGNGLATGGLLVRHLVMPGMGEQTRRIIDFLTCEVSPKTFVNVMGQYRPEYHAGRDPLINRCPSVEEIGEARRYAEERGLRLSN